MPLRILLVDDEQLAIDRLRDLLGKIEDVEIVATADTTAKARVIIGKEHIDLVLLDIQMPGGSGMALAADLPLTDRPEIVFVTAFGRFALDAFEVDAADYLLKPVRVDRLRQAIARAKRRMEATRFVKQASGFERCSNEFLQEIWVQTSGGQIRIDIEMIEWIEAAKDYVVLHTSTRSYLHRMQMSVLEAMIDPGALMRVHRSTFVRLSLVQRLEQPGKGALRLVLRDGAIVQVGPSYVKAVLERLRPKGN